MNHTVTKTSEYAVRSMSCHTTGKVHSVYRKTINILLDDMLLAIQAFDSPLSPISLISDMSREEMSSLQIESGDPVTVSDSAVTIFSKSSRNTFFYGQAEQVNLQLDTALPTADIHLLSENISKAIKYSEVNGFALIFKSSVSQDLDLILNSARTRIADAKKHFTEGSFTSSANDICRLIGLGTGLTPSGDDFICGIFAGLILLGKSNHKLTELLKDEVSLHLDNTNPISAAFLKCSILGQFSQATCSLIHSPDSTCIAEQFIKIGHSSGFDSLCGIYFAFSLFV